MSVIQKTLFPGQYSLSASWYLFLGRLVFGAAFLTHGIAKWNGFAELSADFPDPLGIGAPYSLFLVIVAELFCAVLFIVGLLFRLALLPMITAMGVACFVIHGGDPFAARELSVLYMSIFTLFLLAGPGGFSFDAFIGRSLQKSEHIAGYRSFREVDF